MNTKLLRRAQKTIVAHAAHFNMEVGGEFLSKDELIHDEAPDAECGTAACVAGFVCALVDGQIPILWSATYDRARALLGLDNGAAERLFYTKYWPSEFAARHDEAATKNEKALVASERIDHFIKTKGAITMTIQSIEAMAAEADYYNTLRQCEDRDQRIIDSIPDCEVSAEDEVMADGYEPRREYEDAVLVKRSRVVEKIGGISI